MSERPHEPPFRCARCGAPGDVGQRYCLHCGARLPGVAARPRRLVWAAVLLALAAAAGTGLALGARSARHASEPTLLTVPPPPSTTLTTVAIPSTPATTSLPTTSPTITTGTLPTAPGAPSTAVTTTAPPQPARPSHGIASWPSSRRGYTVILVSIAESAGRDAAVRQAREAARRGLARVGVLLSSEHSSLHPGYWVVFSGRYGSQARAQAALAAAHAGGYPGAYPAHVTP